MYRSESSFLISVIGELGGIASGTGARVPPMAWLDSSFAYFTLIYNSSHQGEGFSKARTRGR
jgi:hypothetical protein